MTKAIKEFVKRIYLYHVLVSIRRSPFLYRLFVGRRRLKGLREWEERGKPVPPPAIVKQQLLERYAREFSLDTLVETGTYMGDTVFELRNAFTEIFSIELSDRLATRASRRFARFSHIHILRGDSGRVLPDLLSSLTRPSLFWLDAHVSTEISARAEKDTPIVGELKLLLDELDGHVVLIDDARCFTGENDYPTIDELRQLVFQKGQDMVFEVNDDVIRIHRK